jgi:hypothetical protein
MIVMTMFAGESSSQTATVRDGIYTSAQAMRGKEPFVDYCSSCHGADLTGRNGPTLKGDAFLGPWLDDSLNDLFKRLKTMPPNDREKPGDDVYLDILAYILEANMFPPGSEELKANLLETIRVTGNDTPGPAPNFALVQVVGCLAQDSKGTWILANASEPVSSRNPDKPTAEELKAAAVQPLGTHTLLLLSPGSFRPGFRIESHRGQKLQGKGFLIRNPADERLNVTWLEPLASNCGQ